MTHKKHINVSYVYVAVSVFNIRTTGYLDCENTYSQSTINVRILVRKLADIRKTKPLSPKHVQPLQHQQANNWNLTPGVLQNSIIGHAMTDCLKHMHLRNRTET